MDKKILFGAIIFLLVASIGIAEAGCFLGFIGNDCNAVGSKVSGVNSDETDEVVLGRCISFWTSPEEERECTELCDSSNERKCVFVIRSPIEPASEGRFTELYWCNEPMPGGYSMEMKRQCFCC